MDNKHSIFLNQKKKTLITVLGWEERFLEGIKFDLANQNIGHLLLLIYSDYFGRLDFNEIMSRNLECLKIECKKNNIIIEEIKLNYSDPIENYKKVFTLKNAITKLTFDSLLVDITTIPREMIWNILTLCTETSSSINLIYHKPCSYDSWLCRNFEKPLLQIGHSGISRFGKQTALIIITGFEVERTKQLINHFEPDIVYLCVQTGEQFENTKRNIESHRTFCSPNLIEFCEIDSYDISLGTVVVNSIVDKLQGYNIIISSQGPKTSSVIAYNAFAKNASIGLVYVPSKDININYSKGIKDSVQYKFK